MKIIVKTPSENGAYPPIQDWPGSKIPDGYARILDSLDTSIFYQYNGFVTLTITRGMVTEMTPNTEAWETWKATLPPEPEPEPTDTEVLNTLLGVTE